MPQMLEGHRNTHAQYYVCPANKDIDHPDVQKSQYLCRLAGADRIHQCKWFRAILPGKMLGNATGWNDEPACIEHEVDDFDHILNTSNQVGSDGAGGQDLEPSTRIAGVGSAVYDPIS